MASPTSTASYNGVSLGNSSTANAAIADGIYCLFCLAAHDSLEDNLAHMRKHHDFAIPHQDRLLVDPETLMVYLQLIVEDYYECLWCGTQRTTSEGARQHMLAKRHCGFAVDEGSELRDFYDFSESEGDACEVLTVVEDGFVRLSSGKVLGSQKVHPRRKPNCDARCQELGTSSSEQAIDVSRGSKDSSTEPSSEALDRAKPAEKKAIALGNQLTRLSAADRSALAHLTPSEQRSRLAVRKKQIDEARRSQRAMQSRVERLGNKTLMKHFVMDVPGPKNG